MTGRWRTAWRRRQLLAEAGVALMMASLTVLLRRRARLVATLGEPVGMSPTSPSAAQLAVARDVGWAVETLAVRGPLRAACLSQALAARVLLQRRNIPCTLTLGVTSRPGGSLRAHAWLRVGEHSITGGRERRAFWPVAGFR